jgi:formylmethanofuran dehydrogenase subunit B
MSPGMTLFSVQAVLILGTEDGSRIFAKYFNAPHTSASGKEQLARPTTLTLRTELIVYAGGPPTNPYPDTKSQKAFEKGLIDKTGKQTGDIILYDNRIVLYKLESDVMIYVVGAADENEILLYNTVLAIRDSLHLLFK